MSCWWHAPVDRWLISLYTGLIKCIPRWLAGFLPSTVSPTCDATQLSYVHIWFMGSLILDLFSWWFFTLYHGKTASNHDLGEYVSFVRNCGMWIRPTLIIHRFFWSGKALSDHIHDDFVYQQNYFTYCSDGKLNKKISFFIERKM